MISVGDIKLGREIGKAGRWLKYIWHSYGVKKDV